MIDPRCYLERVQRRADQRVLARAARAPQHEVRPVRRADGASPDVECMRHQFVGRRRAARAALAVTVTVTAVSLRFRTVIVTVPTVRRRQQRLQRARRRPGRRHSRARGSRGVLFRRASSPARASASARARTRAAGGRRARGCSCSRRRDGRRRGRGLSRLAIEAPGDGEGRKDGFELRDAGRERTPHERLEVGGAS